MDQAFADLSGRGSRTRASRTGSSGGPGAGHAAADPIGFQVTVFFLACVVVAGLYGAATVSRRILAVQALPAALGLVAVLPRPTWPPSPVLVPPSPVSEDGL